MIAAARERWLVFFLQGIAAFCLASCQSSQPGPGPEPTIEQSHKISADGARDYDKFGWSVALSGELLLAGMNIVQSPYQPLEGEARLYGRNEGGPDAWGEVKRFVASDGLDVDLFGFSVAVGQSLAFVGAPWEDDVEVDAGAVHIFSRDQGGAGAWGELKRLAALDGGQGDSFGQALSLDGDTLLVGAPGNSAAAMRGGAAYVFMRDSGGSDQWGESARILPRDPLPAANFGSAVAVDGDTAVVGAWGDNGPGFRCGAAYVFYRNGGTWQQIKKLVAFDAEDRDEFGISVDVSDDLVIVGADLKQGLGGRTGAAYIFGRDREGADQWGLVKKLAPFDLAPDDGFGHSVSISDEFALVGAPWADGPAGMPASLGAVYVFRRNLNGPDNWAILGKAIPFEAGESAQSGKSVALSEDFFAVGAPIKPGGGTYRGAVFLFRIVP